MRNGHYELIVPPAEYPGKRYRGRYAYEHRVNWWRETGKNPDDFPDSLVHHKNDAKRDNDGTNLEMMPRPDHSRLHKRPITMLGYVCAQCGEAFERRARGRPAVFCSRRCKGLHWRSQQILESTRAVAGS